MCARRCVAVGGCECVACYFPIDAWQLASGEVVFAERGDVVRAFQIPCNRCVGCRLDRSLAWSVRCMHEASCYDSSIFVTLTYETDPISLVYRHFQLFCKRVRKSFGSFRFFVAGEYGEQLGRPHFHALLFGIRPDDGVLVREKPFRLWTSARLESLWGHGYVSYGDVTFQSASYVARYAMKKVYGSAADAHYMRVTAEGEMVPVVPEFCRMSLRPGIGAEWYERYAADVRVRDSVIMPGGRQVKIPRYYDRLLERASPLDKAELDVVRYNSRPLDPDGYDRLATRAIVAEAAVAAKLRKL